VEVSQFFDRKYFIVSTIFTLQLLGFCLPVMSVLCTVFVGSGYIVCKQQVV